MQLSGRLVGSGGQAGSAEGNGGVQEGLAESEELGVFVRT